jgi:galactose mutarotase-like enzyme
MSSDSQPRAEQFRGPLLPGRLGPGPIEMWRLTAGNAVAELAPSRGGLVTRFAVGDDEVLYLDPATLADRSQKVRGGIPVLFPIAGRLNGDRYEIEGRSYPMRQHGLARQAPWSVVNVEAAHLTMEFRSDAATRASFPFEFIYQLTVDIGRAGYRSLVLESRIENRGPTPMPLHTGLHPYFLVPEREKDGVRVDVAAPLAFDNSTGGTRPWTGEADFTVGELDLHLADVTRSEVTLSVPGKPPRQLAFAGFYSSVVLWTLSLKDFVCVEPWSAPGDALNSGVGLITLDPGETCFGEFTITV